MHRAHTMPAINTVGEPIYSPRENKITLGGVMMSTVHLIIDCIAFL